MLFIFKDSFRLCTVLQLSSWKSLGDIENFEELLFYLLLSHSVFSDKYVHVLFLFFLESKKKTIPLSDDV